MEKSICWHLCEAQSTKKLQKPVKGKRRIKLLYTCLDASFDFIMMGSNTGSVYVFERRDLELIDVMTSQLSESVLSVCIDQSQCSVGISYTGGYVSIHSCSSRHYRHRHHHVHRSTLSMCDNVTCMVWHTCSQLLYCGTHSGSVVCVCGHSSRSMLELEGVVHEMIFSSNILLISTSSYIYLCNVQEELFTQVEGDRVDERLAVCLSNSYLYCVRPNWRILAVELCGRLLGSTALNPAPTQLPVSSLDSAENVRSTKSSVGTIDYLFKASQCPLPSIMLPVCANSSLSSCDEQQQECLVVAAAGSWLILLQLPSCRLLRRYNLQLDVIGMKVVHDSVLYVLLQNGEVRCFQVSSLNTCHRDDYIVLSGNSEPVDMKASNEIEQIHKHSSLGGMSNTDGIDNNSGSINSVRSQFSDPALLQHLPCHLVTNSYSVHLPPDRTAKQRSDARQRLLNQLTVMRRSCVSLTDVTCAVLTVELLLRYLASVSIDQVSFLAEPDDTRHWCALRYFLLSPSCVDLVRCSNEVLSDDDQLKQAVTAAFPTLLLTLVNHVSVDFVNRNIGSVDCELFDILEVDNLCNLSTQTPDVPPSSFHEETRKAFDEFSNLSMTPSDLSWFFSVDPSNIDFYSRCEQLCASSCESWNACSQCRTLCADFMMARTREHVSENGHSVSFARSCNFSSVTEKQIEFTSLHESENARQGQFLQSTDCSPTEIPEIETEDREVHVKIDSVNSWSDRSCHEDFNIDQAVYLIMESWLDLCDCVLLDWSTIAGDVHSRLFDIVCCRRRFYLWLFLVKSFRDSLLTSKEITHTSVLNRVYMNVQILRSQPELAWSIVFPLRPNIIDIIYCWRVSVSRSCQLVLWRRLMTELDQTEIDSVLSNDELLAVGVLYGCTLQRLSVSSVRCQCGLPRAGAHLCIFSVITGVFSSMLKAVHVAHASSTRVIIQSLLKHGAFIQYLEMIYSPPLCVTDSHFPLGSKHHINVSGNNDVSRPIRGESFTCQSAVNSISNKTANVNIHSRCFCPGSEVKKQHNTFTSGDKREDCVTSPETMHEFSVVNSVIDNIDGSATKDDVSVCQGRRRGNHSILSHLAVSGDTPVITSDVHTRKGNIPVHHCCSSGCVDDISCEDSSMSSADVLGRSECGFYSDDDEVMMSVLFQLDDIVLIQRYMPCYTRVVSESHRIVQSTQCRVCECSVHQSAVDDTTLSCR